MKYLLMAVMLSSCGSAAAPIHPALRPYVQNFERDMGTTIDFPVRMAKVRNPNWAGVCITNGTYNAVHIDPDRTLHLNKTQMEILVYHELGHCAFDLDHWDRMHKGMPISIMYSKVFSKRQAYFWRIHKKFYINQLKNMIRRKQ